MKIVLVDKSSGAFLMAPGQFTRDIHEALNFETEQAAQRYCVKHKIHHSKIVAKFITRQLHDLELGEC